jgi:mono/diheme cytochrome c family protein
MVEAVDVSLSRVASPDIAAMVPHLRTLPPDSSGDLPKPKAEPAAGSDRMMTAAFDPRGKQIFEGACVSCHGWSGESSVTSAATLTGARSINDVAAANVALAVLSGVESLAPSLSMPSFGGACSDVEIAAIANYVTARFGDMEASLTARKVTKLRAQSAP